MLLTSLRLAAACGLALAATPVSADAPTREYAGGCWFEPYADVLNSTPSWNDEKGVLAAAVAVFSDTDPAQNPVSATVTCTFTSYGSVKGVLTASGTGVIAGATDFAFLSSGEPYAVCTRVDYDNGESDASCAPKESYQVPPSDLICEYVDPLGCPPSEAR